MTLTEPFDVLLRANNVVLTNLRRDEATPELQKQLTQTGMPSSAQAYFCDPYSNSYLGPQIRPTSFAMLPAPLARERDRVECMSFMGLLPEIDHAWMTVDNVLFLWNYHTQDFTQYRELKQVIVTVALVPPKRGVFQESVKHVLAVATTVEVVLLAVTYQGESKEASGRNRRIQVRPTNFRASTDGVSMLKMAAHPSGRVFMAGKDGNMYELSYTVSYGFMYSVFFVGDSTGSRKCKRLMHRSSGAPPSPVHALLALLGLRSAERTLVDVVVDPLRNVLYTLDLEGNMDLFDLGSDGNQTTQKMSRFNIWEAAYKFCRWAQNSQNRLPDASIFKDPKKFQVVSLGIIDPTESKEISLVAVSNTGMRFYISCGFSGGSRHNFQLGIVWIRCPPPEALWRYMRDSAQAAQHPYPPPHQHQQQQQEQQQQQPLLLEGPRPAVPPAGGMNNRSVGFTFGAGAASVGGGGGGGLVQRYNQPADGFAAKWERQSTATPSVYQAYCCHGVTILAQTVAAPPQPGSAQQGQQPSGGGSSGSGAGGSSGASAEPRDRLILIGPDLVTRSKRRRDARQEEHPWMREAVTDEDGGAAVWGGKASSMGKVWAVAERPVSIMSGGAGAGAVVDAPRVRTMVVTSRTPSQAEINGSGAGGGGGGGGGLFGGLRHSGAGGSRGAPIARSSSSSGSTSTALAIRTRNAADSSSAGVVHRAMQWRKSDAFTERPIAPSPPLVCSPGGSKGCPGGLLPKDVSRVVALPELGTQPYSHRREMMCLTSSGLQTFAKLRPVDFLYELLAQNQPEKVSLFFDDFSPDQSAAMCFSIACGLPRDLGTGALPDYCSAPGTVGSTAHNPSGFTAAAAAAAAAPIHEVRARALDAALKNCKPPAFSSPHAAVGNGGAGVGGVAGAGAVSVGVVGGVTIGEKFNNSALHNGLQLFIARLLRPFWFHAVVTCKGGGGSGVRTKRSADGRAKGGGDGGTPTILDLEGLIGPLELLRVSIRTAFPRAVAEDLAAKAAKEERDAAAAAAAHAERRTGGHGVHQDMLTNGAASRQPETRQQRQQTAFKMEALEVHAAYRLVTRAAEAVRMVRALARVARDFPKAKVPWSVLSGVTLWKLVTGEDEHKKVASLLADLVGSKVNLPPDSRDALARELGSSCSTFFSQGDVRTFEGLELLRRARTAAGGNAAAAAATEKGAVLLVEAAKEWKGERALGADGQLARACSALGEAGRLDAVVDVCMTCAGNFDPRAGSAGGAGKFANGHHFHTAGGGTDSSGMGVFVNGGVAPDVPANGNALALVLAPTYGGGGGVPGGLEGGRFGLGGGSGGAGERGVLSWEEGAYQGGGVVGAAEREKATLECYQRVLDTVLGLMETPSPAEDNEMSNGGGGRGLERVDGLISRCLAYDAPRLHEMLFGLLEEHDKSLLLRIKTPGVEKYLRKDPQLLFRHFMLHKEYPKAVYLMEAEAHAGRGREMHIRDRVECLVKAISACHKCDLDSSQMVMPGWSLNHAKRQSLEDEMDVMLAQERLLRDLEGSMAPLQRLKDDGRGTKYLEGELGERARVAAEWTWGIADPTDMYGKAMTFFLWEGCLHLLQCCGKDEPTLARKLVRSIIWREVPTRARAGPDSQTQAFLSRGRGEQRDGTSGYIEIDDVRHALDNNGDAKANAPAFEDDGWFGPLLDKVGALARELLSRKETYVLPVETVCLELQRIADAYHAAGGLVPPLCVADTVRQSGVSPAMLLDAYESMNRTCYPRDGDVRLRWLEVMTELLTWTCQTHRPGLLTESVRPERVERLAQDTIQGLEAVRASPSVDRGAEYKIDDLCRQLEERVLPSVRTHGRYR